MLKDVTVPEVADNVEEGKVTSLLVSPGDVIELDQSLLEMETDKAVVAIPSPVAGRLAEFTVGEGDTLAVGAVFARIETDGGADGGAGPQQTGRGAAPEAVPSPRPAPAPAPSPASEPGGTSGTAAGPAAAPSSPPPRAAAPSPPPPARPAAGPSVAEDDGAAPASPALRRLARELGVAIGDVAGTGPGGRITGDDVRDHVRRVLNGETETPRPAARPDGDRAAGPAPAADGGLPDFTRWGPVSVEELPQVRRITGEVMTRAWTTIPMVTQRDRADVTELERFRRQWNGRLAEGAPRLTMTAVLLKICAAALREFPRFNSSLDWPRRELILKDYVHIGVAVDTDRGLLVPVVRDPDRKGVAELAAELADLAARTRARRIAPDELEGGTFSISNLGGIGGTSFDPIVYPPQAAILGVDRSEQTAVWRDGTFVPRLMMPLSLTYDHRVIDGAEGARFLRWICEALEQPLLLSMGGGA